MKSKKMLMFILRLVCGVGLVLLVWRPFVTAAFILAHAPDAAFDLGDNYEMCHSYINYMISRDPNDYRGEHVITDKVLEFALSGPWLIGRTGKGWFVIQKKTHDVHYPCSKDQLQTITGLDISSLDMETDPWPYVVVDPYAPVAKKMANRFCWALLFVVPIIFGFAPYVWRALLSRCNKVK